MGGKVNPELCVSCKGVRLLCKRAVCPILTRFKFTEMVSSKIRGDELFGSCPPEILVGSRTWPNLVLGPLVPPISGSQAELYGRPDLWFGRDVEKIIELRSGLFRSTFRLNVKGARRPSRFLELTQEIAISSIPVDTEIKFVKPPKPVLTFDGILAPLGPSGRVKDLRVVESPKVPKRVDDLISDYDVKASTAMKELYDDGFSSYYITRLLSVGTLGRTKDRILVPTRWSITATDAILANHLEKIIRDYKELGEIRLFSKTYIGNHYELLFLPGSLAFEFVEIWLPKTVWTPQAKDVFIESDGEDRRGRTHYSPLGGGYYAVKLPVYEYLGKIRRSAFAFAVREVTPDYWAPLGSWTIRETCRQALCDKPKTFDDLEEALRDISSRVRTPFDEWYKRARMLQSHMVQESLESFL